MYLKCGYTVYRKVLDYYTGDKDEDAYGMSVFLQKIVFFFKFKFFLDMRKAMPRDKDKKSVIPLLHPVTADEIE